MGSAASIMANVFGPSTIVKQAALNDVDRALAEMQQAEQYRHKILLLGAGECGKSTVVKQIKMIWVKEGMSMMELQEYAKAIRRNIVEAIQCLLENSTALKEPLEDAALSDDFALISRLETETLLTPELGQKISALWLDPGIQRTYARRTEFWLMDATPYYLTEVLRLTEEDFIPTEEDIVMTRVRTTGIVITEVPEAPYTYQIVDVGGQRSERRKWIHCFDDVRAIIFLEGLAGYTQVLFEDNSVNRMRESLNLFAEVVKNPIFKSTPIFVFLNKKDLFEGPFVVACACLCVCVCVFVCVRACVCVCVCVFALAFGTLRLTTNPPPHNPNPDVSHTHTDLIKTKSLKM